MDIKTTLAAVLIAVTSLSSPASATIDDNHNILLRELGERDMTFADANVQIPGFETIQRVKKMSNYYGLTKWVEYAQVAQRMLLNGADTSWVFAQAQSEVNSYYVATHTDWNYYNQLIADQLFGGLDGAGVDILYDYIVSVYGIEETTSIPDPNPATKGGGILDPFMNL